MLKGYEEANRKDDDGWRTFVEVQARNSEDSTKQVLEMHWPSEREAGKFTSEVPPAEGFQENSWTRHIVEVCSRVCLLPQF